MKIYKILWVLVYGISEFAVCFILSVISALTIIGIPSAKMWFSAGKLSLCPFNKEVDIDFSSHKFLNTLWLVTLGWISAAYYYIMGIISFVSIIFIPFGKQLFKLGKFYIAPFGADIS